jgi:hypothetical protein
MSIKIRKIADEVTVKIGCSFAIFFSFFIRSQSINVLAPQIQKSKKRRTDISSYDRVNPHVDNRKNINKFSKPTTACLNKWYFEQ